VTTIPAGPRNADILRRRIAGETLEAIGQAHGITRNRVYQILRKIAEDAKTTEAERALQRALKKDERERRKAEERARCARERQEREEASRRNTLARQIARVEPSWSSLNNFGWWLRENESWYRAPRLPGRRDDLRTIDPIDPEYLPAFRAADQTIARWLDGRANDHMTVLRLRRLTEVPA
jgi:hypothetical protein